jgi:hypothetical protein
MVLPSHTISHSSHSALPFYSPSFRRRLQTADPKSPDAFQREQLQLATIVFCASHG